MMASEARLGFARAEALLPFHFKISNYCMEAYVTPSKTTQTHHQVEDKSLHGQCLHFVVIELGAFTVGDEVAAAVADVLSRLPPNQPFPLDMNMEPEIVESKQQPFVQQMMVSQLAAV